MAADPMEGDSSTRPPVPKVSYTHVVGNSPPRTFTKAVSNHKDLIPEVIDLFKPLTAYQGEPAIFLSPDESARLVAPLKLSLIAKCSYGRPAFPAIREFFKKNFHIRQDYNIGVLDQRHLLIRYFSEEDYLSVYLKKYYYINVLLLRFIKWTPTFCSESRCPFSNFNINPYRNSTYFLDGQNTLRAGKLTEKVLKVFMATGKDEILSLIEALNIQHILTPVLPTSKLSSNPAIASRFPNWGSTDLELFLQDAQRNSKRLKLGVHTEHLRTEGQDSEVDIVIAALRSDLTSFLEEWRSVFSQFHLIIVKDPDLKEDLQIPEGFDHDVYTKSDIDRTVGPAATTLLFSGYSCRYFGYLISRKKYIVSFDDDCVLARDDKGCLVDAVAQHITNLRTPATPFFFNTLYDPYRTGADFVRGYPFSLRNGVKCALSCGLWLNLADYDAPTQALKPGERNSRYVDAVLTVPLRAMMPMSGINVAFDREVVGPALFPGLRLAGEGKQRWETIEDIWCGMCAKVVCDHLGLGVKSGLPYVWRKDGGDAIASLMKEWEGVKLMEEVVPFFQSLRFPLAAVTAEDCMLEIARTVKERLGKLDPVFTRSANAMVEWVRLWKAVGSGSSSTGA
ncbi:hypothetical protein HHK36_027204 [Tetracentron sinense]|uniref:DUF4283 domain-containing protein n=1 Tax=Tetracentron sinense TaxID=13715 RepID=A0A834YGF1_TETSI|nr:hypothetical protein HHK36_027204 [Tetracentron sinense]